MKLHIVGTANRRISNIEPQNVEGWNRVAQSFLKSTEYITSTFDIHYSMLTVRLWRIRYSLFQSFFSDQTDRFFASGWAET